MMISFDPNALEFLDNFVMTGTPGDPRNPRSGERMSCITEKTSGIVEIYKRFGIPLVTRVQDYLGLM